MVGEWIGPFNETVYRGVQITRMELEHDTHVTKIYESWFTDTAFGTVDGVKSAIDTKLATEPIEGPGPQPEDPGGIVYGEFNQDPDYDEQAADIIFEEKHWPIFASEYLGNSYIQGKHLILIGGPFSNVFTNWFFPELKYETPGNYWINPYGGTSTDGTYVVATRIRNNSQQLTVIAGDTGPNTIRAANAFLADEPPPPPPPPPNGDDKEDPVVGYVCKLPIYEDLDTGLLYFTYYGALYDGFTSLSDVENYLRLILNAETCDVDGGPPPPPPDPGDDKTASTLIWQTEFWKAHGNDGGLQADNERGTKIKQALTGLLDGIGLSTDAIEDIATSPVNRDIAAQMATGISQAAQLGLGILYSMGLAAEVLSLGQIDTVVDVLDGVLVNTGVADILKPLFMAPYWPSLIVPTRQYWRKKYPSEIPPSQDLIRMVVREVLSVALFKENMAYQGYDEAWSDRYWEAHWRLPAVQQVWDAYHRKVITAEERDSYLIWLDYKPENRPGISKNDLTILAGIQKTPIGRVDIRRAYESGASDRADMITRYEWLGYEDDSELMADIQIQAATVGERQAVARPAGRIFRDGGMSEGDYRALLNQLNIKGEIQDLWVRRYQWEALARDLTPDQIQEQLEEMGIVSEPEEEE